MSRHQRPVRVEYPTAQQQTVASVTAQHALAIAMLIAAWQKKNTEKEESCEDAA